MTSKGDVDELIKSRLSNFIRLPKAHRWMCCEWFYSDIDKVIFDTENDFTLCLKQSFPRLKTTKLRRKQWSLIRTMIGKPRRCSDAFFREERQVLDEKRQRIRMIQQRRLSEHELAALDLAELPAEIPIMLSVGQRVYTHIIQPEQGVFLGTIAAVDPVEHTYRVVFDRHSLGSQTVSDYEVKSLSGSHTVPIRVYLQTYRPPQAQTSRTASTNLSGQIIPPSHHLAFLNSPSLQSIFLNTPIARLTPTVSSIIMEDLNNPAIANALMFQSAQDRMLGLLNSPKLGNNDTIVDPNTLLQTPLGELTSDTSGNILLPSASVNQIQVDSAPSATDQAPIETTGFPIHLLLMITRLSKILQVKRDLIIKLNDMNAEAERIRASTDGASGVFSKEFQMNYAILVLDLEKLNKDLSEYLNGVQRYCEDCTIDFRLRTVDIDGTLTNLSPTSSTTSVDPNSGSLLVSEIKLKHLKESTKLVNRLNRIDENNETQIKIEDNMNKINLNETLVNSGEACQVNRSGKIKSKKTLDLIIKLTSLLSQLKEFVNATSNSSTSNLISNHIDTEDSSNSQDVVTNAATTGNGKIFVPFCMRALAESMNEIKHGLSTIDNAALFEDKVQIHVNHVESMLSSYNKLNAFTKS